MKRLFYDVLLLILVFTMPWWVSLLFSIIGLLIFSKYYEFLVSSIIINTLSSPVGNYTLGKPFIIYLSIVIFYLTIEYLRSYIYLYKNEISHKT